MYFRHTTIHYEPSKHNKRDISYAYVCVFGISSSHRVLATLRNILCVGHVPSTSSAHTLRLTPTRPQLPPTVSGVVDRFDEKARVIKLIPFRWVWAIRQRVGKKHILSFFLETLKHVDRIYLVYYIRNIYIIYLPILTISFFLLAPHIHLFTLFLCWKVY